MNCSSMNFYIDNIKDNIKKKESILRKMDLKEKGGGEISMVDENTVILGDEDTNLVSDTDTGGKSLGRLIDEMKEAPTLKELNYIVEKPIKEIVNKAEFIAQKTKYDLLKYLDMNNDGKFNKEDILSILRTIIYVFVATFIFVISQNPDNLNSENILDSVIYPSVTATISIFVKIWQHQKTVAKNKATELVGYVIDEKQEKIELREQIKNLKLKNIEIKKEFMKELEHLRWLIMLELTENDLQKIVKDSEARKSIEELEKLKEKYKIHDTVL